MISLTFRLKENHLRHGSNPHQRFFDGYAAPVQKSTVYVRTGSLAVTFAIAIPYWMRTAIFDYEMERLRV